jgi:drug/metabolite transporter (DMT)-like permease
LNRDSVGLRATVGRVLGLLGVVCAVVGIFVLNGISIEFPGIMLGGLGYYFSLTGRDPLGQILGIFAAALNAVSMGVSGLEGPPQ